MQRSGAECERSEQRGGAGERSELSVRVWRAKRAAGGGGRRQASHSRRRRRFASNNINGLKMTKDFQSPQNYKQNF